MEKTIPDFFRFYKGEYKNPYDSSQSNKAALWDCERYWFIASAKLPESDYLSEYMAVGLSDFSDNDGVPVMYKALVFHRYAKTAYSLADAVEPFKKLYHTYYKKEG